MRGQVLTYGADTGEGVISAQDGKRYTFKGTEYRGDVLKIRPLDEVDFEPREDNTATAVYGLKPAAPAYGGKSNIAAGILGVFLGGIGVHKFYLGYTTPAVVMLLCGTLGWLLILPGLAVWLIGFIEGILYLTKSPEEFETVYVKNARHWF
jgi:TM2 domain-containing membrane protein YozV